MSKFLVPILIFIFGVLLTIIGYFVARALSKIDKSISSIFKMLGEQEKDITAFKLDVAKNYITKEECEKQEQQRDDFLKRIEEYRARHKPVEAP